MTTVAVLASKALGGLAFLEWLAPAGARVLLFTADDAVPLQDSARGLSYLSVSRFPDWKQNPDVERAVISAHAQHPIDRIVVLGESDQLRAAQLREHLGIAGQSVASATAFRDKVVMKSLASAHGLAVPAFARVDTIVDLEDFTNRHPGPFVIKPVDGAGATGVEVVPDGAAALAWARDRQIDATGAARLIIEEFVDAPIVSVDGFMADGRVLAATVSTYTLSCHASLAGLAPHGLLHVDANDSMAERALSYTSRLLRALPCPVETSTFHCELFDDPLRGMLLCEIACRTGGGRIPDMMKSALGAHPDVWGTLGHAGFDPTQFAPRTAASRQLMGDVLFPNPGRRLRSAPTSCPIDGVLEFQIHAAVGEFVPRATKVSEVAAEALFHAPDRAALERTYADVVAWLDATLVWDDETPP